MRGGSSTAKIHLRNFRTGLNRFARSACPKSLTERCFLVNALRPIRPPRRESRGEAAAKGFRESIRAGSRGGSLEIVGKRERAQGGVNYR